jgi:hypothetical protein
MPNPGFIIYQPFCITILLKALTHHSHIIRVCPEKVLSSSFEDYNKAPCVANPSSTSLRKGNRGLYCIGARTPCKMYSSHRRYTVQVLF